MLRSGQAKEQGQNFDAGTQRSFDQARALHTHDVTREAGGCGMRVEGVAGKRAAKSLEPAIVAALDGFGKAWRRRAFAPLHRSGGC